MTKDPGYSAEAARCDLCCSFEDEAICACADGGRDSDNAAQPQAKVIDFKQRTSELRQKGMESGSVSPLEATRALAFGMMHLQGGLGVPRDTAKAAKFLSTAAKGDIAQAKHELAQLHIHANGVPYDPEYAIRLLKDAAEAEYLPSMISLAELYIFAKHCPKDLEAALDLLYAAAGRNEPSIMYYLAYVYDKEPEYRNCHEAAYWYRRTAEHGHFKSQIRLASLYATGVGVPHCPDTAEAFLEVALESAGEQDPKFLLWQGERLAVEPRTRFMAQALVKAAADMQHPPAQRAMLQHGWRA